MPVLLGLGKIKLVVLALALAMWVLPATGDEAPLTRDEVVVRMVLQEANGEPFPGMIAVAAVAFDRAADPRWPQDLRGVVYQPWQFTAMRYTLGDFTEDDVAIARYAVELAREGARPCGPGVLWYHVIDLEHPASWPSMHERCKIGNHVFFAEAPWRR